MRTKSKNLLRDTCIFTDGRKSKVYSGTRTRYKGYVDSEGYHIGLTIIYTLNKKLDSIGFYDPDKKLRDRRIGHWKYYDENGTIQAEQIIIK